MTVPDRPSTDGVCIYDRSGAPIALARYIKLHADDRYRIVASHSLGDRRVVTACLGIDHGPLDDSSDPLIFGTVALEADGQFWQGQELLAAREVEARRHHQEVVAQLS